MGKLHKGRAYEKLQKYMRGICDGWCQVPGCKYPGIPILLDAEPRTPLSYSMDHIIPVSMGGEHVLENVRHAHYGCNSARKDGRKLKPRGSSSRPY
jgi:5-methylcytosine-specific restriction endonuclease McrA